MTASIKLLNQGSRKITHSLGVLAPGKAVELPQAEALKLKRLYRGELLDIETVVEKFEAAEVVAPAPAAPAKPKAKAAADKDDEDAKLLAELEAEEKAKAAAATSDKK
jgi:hypothetical protein